MCVTQLDALEQSVEKLGFRYRRCGFLFLLYNLSFVLERLLSLGRSVGITTQRPSYVKDTLENLFEKVIRERMAKARRTVLLAEKFHDLL